ncbi:hypothetical protein REPUB_Repub03eG0095500 [Reevesia pubescens]
MHDQRVHQKLLQIGCSFISVGIYVGYNINPPKIRDINELSRQEVDEVIYMFRQDLVSASDDMQKRRYIAIVEMCQVTGNRDQLISLLLPLAEHILNIILIHFQDKCFLCCLWFSNIPYLALLMGEIVFLHIFCLYVLVLLPFLKFALYCKLSYFEFLALMVSGVFDTNGSMKTITYCAKPDSGQEISSSCGKLIPPLERLELLSEDKVGQNLKVFRRLVTWLKEMAIQKFAL